MHHDQNTDFSMLADHSFCFRDKPFIIFQPEFPVEIHLQYLPVDFFYDVCG